MKYFAKKFHENIKLKLPKVYIKTNFMMQSVKQDDVLELQTTKLFPNEHQGIFLNILNHRNFFAIYDKSLYLVFNLKFKHTN